MSYSYIQSSRMCKDCRANWGEIITQQSGPTGGAPTTFECHQCKKRWEIKI